MKKLLISYADYISIDDHVIRFILVVAGEKQGVMFVRSLMKKKTGNKKPWADNVHGFFCRIELRIRGAYYETDIYAGHQDRRGTEDDSA